MVMGPLMIDVEGYTLSNLERRRLKHPSVGGVVLFSRNYQDPDQLPSLVAAIKGIKAPALLVAVDQEGGRVQRFRDGFTTLPAQRRVGKLFDEDPLEAEKLAWVMGRVMAWEVRQAGIDVSFAPVLDLFDPKSRAIGDRAFHSNPSVVARLAQHLSQGMRASGMMGVAKHYPGHGGVLADSHNVLPIDNRTLGEIENTDLVPYIQSDLATFGAIMTCHIQFPSVDEFASTFSTIWIGEVLRSALGYRGAVLSDDLSMDAARAAGTLKESAFKAIAAGCDMVLMCNDPDAVDIVLRSRPEFIDKNSIQRLSMLYGRRQTERINKDKMASWSDRLQAIV